jgi:cysteine desulfurase
VIYLDSNATTRPDPSVILAMREMLEERWHNPSSIHRLGQAARQKVELARQSIARLIGAQPRDIILTSGATESIDLAIRGTLLAAPLTKRAIVTTAIEHEAIRDLCKALSNDAARPIEIRQLPVMDGGVVDAEALHDLLDDSVAIVSVQWANNETGAIQPIERIGAICRERGVPFHSDGTQWVGKMPVDVASSPIDYLSFSAHKFHGPKGAGALYFRPRSRFRPVIHGSQERERRGGTENTAGIVGMGVASEVVREWLADPANRQAVARKRDRLEKAILEAVPDAVVNAPADRSLRLWNTTNIGFPRLEAEALLLLMSERGVCASAGAACSSGSLEPSPILRAMHVPPERAHGSIRLSLSRFTTDEEVEEAARIIVQCVERLRSSVSALSG